MTEKAKFLEAANGYGFDEIEQEADGVYCTGCYVVHKRSTKMYTDGAKEVLCRFQVVRLYFDEEANDENPR
jgi:hypothetical protein